MTGVMTGIITAVFASSGIWSIVLYLLQRRDSRKSAVKKALIALLHDRIYSECEAAIMEGHISMKDFKNISYLYEPYEELGGNGTGRTLYEEVKKLTKTED